MVSVWRVTVESWVAHTAGEASDGDRRFEAGEWGAEAEVLAETEGEVTVGASGVESRGIGEDGWVVVGGGDQHDGELTGCDVDAGELDGVASDSWDQLDW